jgi:hypothetical protein
MFETFAMQDDAEKYGCSESFRVCLTRKRERARESLGFYNKREENPNSLILISTDGSYYS